MTELNWTTPPAPVADDNHLAAAMETHLHPPITRPRPDLTTGEVAYMTNRINRPCARCTTGIHVGQPLVIHWRTRGSGSSRRNYHYACAHEDTP